MLKYGVIGYGYWGPNLARVFNQAEGSKLVAVADRDEKSRARAAGLYPNIVVHSDARELIADPAIDVVAIATPVSTHFALAEAALKAGKHVVVEKPLCGSSDEAARLVELAAKVGRQILTDHTFVYTDAVRKIADMSANGELGRILYYDSTRINLGLFQSDVNVIWDLAVHDFAILSRIMPAKPEAIGATAIDPMGTATESLTYITLYYPGNTVAHIHASWLAPVKIRSIIIGGDRSMVVYDDVDVSEKIRIYDKGISIIKDPEVQRQMRVAYRVGDMRAPKLDGREALGVMAQHANECFTKGVAPITSGEVGLQVVRLLESAEASARKGGQIIRL
ncbi:MAG: oxidoreductase [Rhodospirillum sp.]|nr:oxidoreductase [Rhodospirillum sp.]